jgi:hypothetical protein
MYNVQNVVCIGYSAYSSDKMAREFEALFITTVLISIVKGKPV